MRPAIICALIGVLLIAQRRAGADEVLYAEPAASALGMPLPVGPVPIVIEQPPPVFVEADYLLWWVRPAPIGLPLAATPGGQVLSPTSIDPSPFSGLRVRIGLAPHDNGEPGIELGGLVLPRTGDRIRVSAPGSSPTGLVVPFRDGSRTPPTEGGLVVAGPLGGAFVPGDITVSSASEAWGADLAASVQLPTEGALRVDLRGGLRHFFFSDTLTIQTRSVKAAESFSTFDRFLTRNYYFGALGGARVAWANDRFEARLRTDLALGVTAENLRVGGLTARPASAVRARPGPTVVNGGLFSVGSLGITREARFAVLPDLGLDLGFRLSDAVRLTIGYNILYLSDVRRAGEQVSRQVNARALPVNGGDFNNLPTPAPIYRRSDVTLHGLNLGLAIQF